VAPFEGAAREILHCFKFDDQPELARPLGLLMARLLGSQGPIPGLVVPVPQRLLKRRLRGYDPAAMLARTVSRASGIPAGRRVLVKTRHTRDQALLASREERAANIAGAFRVRRMGAGRVRGRRILLVDDVLTTGATGADCARALLEAGAARVDVLVFARTLRARLFDASGSPS
jgi:ComF family protein